MAHEAVQIMGILNLSKPTGVGGSDSKLRGGKKTGRK